MIEAILSLTSYPARIANVDKTIVKHLMFKNNIKIVLNLYEGEFPNKENDLPENLKLLIENNLVEILWHKKNYRVLMKTLFAMEKYKTLPVISADDDNLPLINYPKILLDEWKKDKSYFISFWGKQYKNTYNLGGNFTISPPYAFGKYGIKCLTDAIIDTKEDDPYYTVLRSKLNLNKCKIINKYKVSQIIKIHDEISPLHDIYRNRPVRYAMSICEKEIKIN